MAREKQFRIQGAFGSRHGQPFVQITLGGEFVQVSPAKARQLGMMLLEAAEMSEGDAFLVGFVADMVGHMTREHSAVLLHDFREFRSKRRALEVAELEPIEEFNPEEPGKEG